MERPREFLLLRIGRRLGGGGVGIGVILVSPVSDVEKPLIVSTRLSLLMFSSLLELFSVKKTLAFLDLDWIGLDLMRRLGLVREA